MRKLLAILFVFALIGPSQAVVLINEVDADTPGTDIKEFVELYNTDVAAVDLAAGSYVLVLYNGSDNLSYNAWDLTGTIAGNGYYVIGNSAVTPAPDQVISNGSVQNGADAVALYSATSASFFPNDTPMTSAISW